MDQRGQISVEYILLAAIVMLVVIVFGSVIMNNNELNSVASAVRIGAENGTTELSLLNRSMQPVRVTSVSMSEINGTGNYNINVSFSGPVTSVQEKVLNSINNSLTGSGFKTDYTGGPMLNLSTSRHKYTITLYSPL
ncbi:MAG: class III signal peptide-containing protein [Methanobacterium sp.]|nr:MAG: class III signal peptide-containing protein [Methanobacterium sp.]